MKIKEILEEIKEKNETYKECSENGIIENEYYKSHLLLDYIINLQTIEREYSSILSENAELESKITNLQEENERLLKKSYKDDVIITKAIEYIGNPLDNYWEEEAKYLLNILQGEDNQ